MRSDQGWRKGMTRKKSKSFVFDDVDIKWAAGAAASCALHHDHFECGGHHAHHHGSKKKMMMAAMSGALAGGVPSGGLAAPPQGQPKKKRRPDRKPFILDVPGSVFFPSRSMPKACSKYAVVIGEAFWKLVAYLDSVPSRLSERIEGKKVHLLLTGVHGSGKSYLMAAAAAMLGFGSLGDRDGYGGATMSVNGDEYRTVFIGDCRRWLESEDPLQYFRMELLSAFRNDGYGGDHADPAHMGCLVCVEPFSRLDQVRSFIQKCCAWIERNRPDTWFIFFIDQAEELGAKPNSAPYKIVQMLLEAKLPILVFSQTTPDSRPFAFASSIGASIQVPFRMAQGEFTKQIEQLSSPEDRLWGREVSLWKDVRLWTGGNPGETARLMACAGPSFLHKIAAYSEAAQEQIYRLVSSKKLEPRQRNTLLIAIFAMVLRVPLDWSDKFNVKELKELDPELSALLQTECLQTFFHPSDGTISVRSIPTAISMASHLALMSPRVLASITKTWTGLFETVVSAMNNSKQLCSEAKRRFARFYLHAKVLWRLPPPGKDQWVIKGTSQMSEDLSIKFKHPRIVLFAGQVPSQYHFLGSAALANSATAPTSTGNPLLAHDRIIDPFSDEKAPYDSIVFLPGRTSYLFFDAFVYLPDDRRLYAITTAPVVATWLKELETRVGPSQLQQHRDEGLLTPLILLESWKETLRKVGIAKVTIKCCLVKPGDLLLAAGCPASTAAATKSKEDAGVDEFVKATSQAPEKDDIPE